MIEAVVVDTLESAPGEDTHWSTRGLAAKHGISHQTVAEIWRAFGLKPWRQGTRPPLIWHKSADEILQRLAGYCTAITTDDNLSASS